jgi:hypothetical protein
VGRYFRGFGISMASGFGIAGVYSWTREEPYNVGEALGYGALFTVLIVGMDLIIDPDPYNINRINRNLNNYKQKMDYYSSPPNF